MEDKRVVFRLPDPEGELTRIMLLRVGFSQVKPYYSVLALAKPTYTVKVVMAGEGFIEAGAKQLPFKMGDVLLFWKGQRYKWWTNPKALLRHYWVDIDGPLAAELFKYAGSSPQNPVLSRAGAPAEEVGHFEELMVACGDYKPSAYWRCLTSFYALWQSISSTLNEALMSNNTRPPAARAKAFIDTHFCERITLREIAMAAGVVPEYLSCVFSAQYGLPPFTYVVQRRLHMAKGLLEKGCRVQDVALSVGYSDARYFARLFSSKYGYPPSATLKDKNKTSLLPIKV